jgi:hypothetical protein
VSEELVAKERLARASDNGYDQVRLLPSGEVAGIKVMLFTTALVLACDEDTYRARFCYEQPQDAIFALLHWSGSGDPPGPWIVEKPAQRFGPGALPHVRIPD